MRNAIASANVGDTITFASGLSGTITLSQGPLNINKNLTISGPGAGILAIDGNSSYTIFIIANGQQNTFQVSISGLTIQHGNGNAGGIENRATLTVNNSTFSGNIGASGGGINNFGTLTVNNSTFSHNSSNDGGGIRSGSSALTVSNSTFSGNSAYFSGGAIDGSGVISNSTFFNNTARAGGGIVADNSITITNSTISGNSAMFSSGYGGGGGILVPNIVPTVIVNLSSTIVAGNTSDSTGPDIAGTVVSQDYNVIGNTSGTNITHTGAVPPSSNPGPGPHDQLNINPLLSPIANNGGSTQTVALQQNSPARGHGGPNCPPTDERGLARSGGCDAGAYQFQAVVVVNTTADPLIPGACNTPLPSTNCTLRQAIAIVGPGGTIEFNLTTPATINLGPGQGTLTIQQAMTINGPGFYGTHSGGVPVNSGPGARLLAIDGGAAVQIFNITTSDTVYLRGLTIQNGSSNVGGGLLNSGGTVNIDQSIFTNNFAGSEGAGIENSSGTMKVDHSVFNGNHTSGGQNIGGGINNSFGATLTITNTAFYHNSATEGAALSNYGTTTITNSTLYNNNWQQQTYNSAIYVPNGFCTLEVALFHTLILAILEITLTSTSGQGSPTLFP